MIEFSSEMKLAMRPNKCMNAKRCLLSLLAVFGLNAVSNGQQIPLDPNVVSTRQSASLPSASLRGPLVPIDGADTVAAIQPPAHSEIEVVDPLQLPNMQMPNSYNGMPAGMPYPPNIQNASYGPYEYFEPLSDEEVARLESASPINMEHIPLENLQFSQLERYQNYRVDESMLSYLPGDGESFGWLSFQSTPYQRRGQRSGFSTAMSLHLLSGPNSSPLPPRLWDFSMAYQKRGSLTERLSFDAATSVGIYSDFEDSARDGVRFPAHAVGMFHWNSNLDVVFGVDYVSRDDVKLLPVFGYSWHDYTAPEWRFDMVFPRPRISYSAEPDSRFYLTGILDGGTWDIEMPGDVNDVMTYRDIKLLLGHERIHGDGEVGAFELGFVFARHLQFRTSPVETNFDDAFVFRIVHTR